MDAGFDRLLTTLAQQGAEGMHLPSENVTTILAAAKAEGLPWQTAWPLAINRLQAPAEGGVIDHRLAADLRLDRALLEENRSYFRACYEGRAETPRERAGRVARAWTRLDGAGAERPAQRSQGRARNRARAA